MKETINQNLIKKPPVVVMLGHVDHGKTSILDYIRKTNIAEKESGFITQHISAYQIEKDGKKITFIDTPGHEAFSNMRSRGAKVADIAVLVVDATQGVQAQTKEVIENIKKTNIPLIVVLNKIDLPNADPERIKGELRKEDILVEDFGGQIPTVKTSAKTGQGIGELLDLIFLIAEMENLTSDISQSAQGVIIEAHLDPKRGPAATIILNEGILKIGDFIATSSTWGKIKILETTTGEKIDKVYPSQPAVIIGFEKIPLVGQILKVFPDKDSAKSYVKVEEKKALEVPKTESENKVLNLILKTDVLGSIEAIEGVLKKIPQEKVVLKILKSEVGLINESDIELAKTTNALILGFKVKLNAFIKELAQREKIRIMVFEVIYDLVEEIKKIIERISKPEIIRIDLGKLKVLVNFWKEKNRQIIGGRIIEGIVEKGASIEILREDEIKGRGKMINLQKNKKDIERATQGEEVGILYEGEEKIEVSDILIFYKEEKEKKN